MKNSITGSRKLNAVNINEYDYGTRIPAGKGHGKVKELLDTIPMLSRYCALLVYIRSKIYESSLTKIRRARGDVRHEMIRQN